MLEVAVYVNILVPMVKLNHCPAVSPMRLFGAFFGAGDPPSQTNKAEQPSQFDRYEAKRFIRAPQCLSGTKDNACDTFPSFPPLVDHPATLGTRCIHPHFSACQAIFGDGDPGGIMAGTQHTTKEEDDEGPAQSADRRVNKRHNSGLGRLRLAHV